MPVLYARQAVGKGVRVTRSVKGKVVEEFWRPTSQMTAASRGKYKTNLQNRAHARRERGAVPLLERGLTAEQRKAATYNARERARIHEHGRERSRSFARTSAQHKANAARWQKERADKELEALHGKVQAALSPPKPKQKPVVSTPVAAPRPAETPAETKRKRGSSWLPVATAVGGTALLAGGAAVGHGAYREQRHFKAQAARRKANQDVEKWLRSNKQYISPEAEKGYRSLHRRQGEYAMSTTAGLGAAGMGLYGAGKARGKLAALKVPLGIAGAAGLGTAAVGPVRIQSLERRKAKIRAKAAERKAAGQLGRGRVVAAKADVRTPTPPPARGPRPMGSSAYFSSPKPYEQYTGEKRRRSAEMGAAGFDVGGKGVAAAGTAALGMAAAGHPLVNPVLRAKVKQAGAMSGTPEGKAAAKQGTKVLAHAAKHRGKYLMASLPTAAVGYGMKQAARTRRDESASASDAINRMKARRAYESAVKRDVSKSFAPLMYLGGQAMNLSENPAARKAAASAQRYVRNNPTKAKVAAGGVAALGTAGVGAKGYGSFDRRRSELRLARRQAEQSGR